MHKLFDPIAEREYAACVADLLNSDEVLWMKNIRHHHFVTCYEHSLFVSYVAYRLARHWNIDVREAARAGLLHDLFLYDKLCAVIEGVYLYRLMKLDRRMQPIFA